MALELIIKKLNMNLQTKETIRKVLYGIAIVLLLLNIFNHGAGKENRIVEVGGWMFLIIASVYSIYLSKEKKKEEEVEG